MMSIATESLEEARVFARNEPSNGEEILHVFARFYARQSLINRAGSLCVL
jgi:hypothetical protein